jgi:hypothetical protein
MDDWEMVRTQLAELRCAIGRAQGMVDVINIKLDAIGSQLRVTQWWTLVVGLVLAADFLATALALRIALR